MCVAAQLGLNDIETGLVREAIEAWEEWGQLEPTLRVVDGLVDLPDWIRSADRATVDEVLLALARLASPRGGDEVAAAGALAWLLMPGARLVAMRLQEHSDRIDELVAAQLWIEVRSFPWERLGRVAANILRNTRRGVLIDLGIGAASRRADPTWAHTRVLDEALESRLAADSSPEPDDRAGELAELLRLALRENVIGMRDVELLRMLSEALHRHGSRVPTRGRGGFCSARAARDVAAALGVAEVTVRRRAASSLRALSELGAAHIPA